MASRLDSVRCNRGRGVAVVLSITALLFCVDDALAQGTQADRELARTRMAEGRARRQAKDLRGALESFRAADALLHFPTTGLELARAEADLGLLVESRETLTRIVAVAEPTDELPQFKKARAEAVGLIGELERHIPTIRVVVTGAPMGTSFALAVDGVSIAPAGGAEPIRVNPGHHVVVATAASGRGEEEVDIEAQESKEITVSLPTQAAPPSAAVTPALSVAPSDGGSPDTRHPTLGKDRTLEFVGFGVAGLGATVASIAGLASIFETKSAESGCSGGRCPPSTWDDLRTAHTWATVSNVSFVLAGAGLGGGIVGLLLKPTSSRAATGAAVVPWLGLGSAGVHGTF